MYVTLPWIQNNCSSLEAFSPEIKIGFNSLKSSTYLNKRIFQFLCLSIISVLSCNRLICAVFKLKLPLLGIDNYDVSSAKCNIKQLLDTCSVVEIFVNSQTCYQSQHVQLSFHMLFQCNCHQKQDKKTQKQLTNYRKQLLYLCSWHKSQFY